MKKGKPAPDIFLLAAERIHVPPASCLVFEDSPHGIAGAAEGGFIPVMIPCILPPAEENKKVAHIYKNLREAGHALLKKILKNGKLCKGGGNYGTAHQGHTSARLF